MSRKIDIPLKVHQLSSLVLESGGTPLDSDGFVQVRLATRIDQLKILELGSVREWTRNSSRKGHRVGTGQNDLLTKGVERIPYISTYRLWDRKNSALYSGIRTKRTTI